jgi:RNA polymerase sigma factor FliA
MHSYKLAGLPPADELVVHHGELVKRIGHYLVSRLPTHIEVDDLIQAGMMGLLNAARNFVPTKGENFETYACIRIRGAMLDEARRSNWTPRSTFRNAKQVSLAIRSIENRTGRDAKAQEIAGTLGVSLEEYTGWSKARRRAVS